MGKEDSKVRKAAQYKRIYELFSKYKQIVVVKIMNVGSRQVQDIRRMIQKRGGHLLIGKNTLIRRVLLTRSGELDKNHPFYDELKKFGDAIPELDALKNSIESKVGFVFTDEPVFELKPLIEANKVQTAAKVGTTAPIDVTIPPGPTGMDPSQISFFHALQISTKIQKGQIEIVKEFKVCETGTKVTNSQAALLQKLNIKPFEYGMEVLGCYDNGSMLNKQQVSVSLTETLKNFQANAQRIAALSLATGIVTELSVPHTVLTAFKNLAAIGIQTGYEFAQLKAAQSGGAPAQQAQAPAQKAQEAPKEAPKKEEVVEEDVDMGGLFDM